MNWKVQKQIDGDVEENHKFYASLAGACSCDMCRGESWYVADP